MPSTLETNLATTQSLAADMIPLIIKERLLQIAEKQTVFFEIGDRETLPEGQGKTVQFTRYERLALPGAPLLESQTPDATPLTTSVVQAVVDQWGAVVSLSDVAQLTVRHPVLRVAQQRLGTQHAETIDREIQKTLMGGTNVTFANSKASRSALAAGDVLTTDDVRRVVSTLRNTGAPTLDGGGDYIGVFDPFVEMDVSKDATFVNASSFSQVRQLLVGEVGLWMGVRWKRSNLIPVIINLATPLPTAVAPPTLMTGFTATTGFVTGKLTRLDATTGFETAIVPSTEVTSGSAFALQFVVPGDFNTYNVYCSVETATGGGAGIETFQLQLAQQGVATTVRIAKALGTGTETFVVGGATDRVLRVTGSVAPPNASTAGNVHISYVFGRESFGVVELGGLTTTITPSTPSESDPLMQRRKVGWKQLFKAVIKNPNFFRRIESLSAFN